MTKCECILGEKGRCKKNPNIRKFTDDLPEKKYRKTSTNTNAPRKKPVMVKSKKPVTKVDADMKKLSEMLNKLKL